MNTVNCEPDCAIHIPSVAEVIASPATSYWLSSSLQSAVLRDPLDAVNDAELLLQLLQKRLDDLVLPVANC